MKFERDIFLQMDDADLSAVCRISFSKGSGPGGQKRNKTSSLAKVELPELDLSASDCTERSQFRNRANALHKLRMQIAFKYRQSRTMPPDNPDCSVKSPNYPLFAAQLLDILDSAGFDHRAAAEIYGITPSALIKKIFRDPDLWQAVQKQRAAREMHPLLPPK